VSALAGSFHLRLTPGGDALTLAYCNVRPQRVVVVIATPTRDLPVHNRDGRKGHGVAGVNVRGGNTWATKKGPPAVKRASPFTLWQGECYPAARATVVPFLDVCSLLLVFCSSRVASPWVAHLTSQGIKDRAIRHVATSTFRDHAGEYALKPLQVSELAADVGNMMFGDALDLATRLASTTCKFKKHAHLPERKTQFARAPDEDQALSVLAPVEPVSARTTRRLRQDADAFVVTDGLDVHRR
jgi:hypothetical protein